jgi:hypothetical protein
VQEEKMNAPKPAKRDISAINKTQSASGSSSVTAQIANHKVNVNVEAVRFLFHPSTAQES